MIDELDYSRTHLSFVIPTLEFARDKADILFGFIILQSTTTTYFIVSQLQN